MLKTRSWLICVGFLIVLFSIQAHSYEPDILKLLGPREPEERVVHTLLGTLGQLFQDFDAPIATPKCTNKIIVEDAYSGRMEIYDNFENRWTSLKVLESIPSTFTFAPKPTNLLMELDYFLRGAGLVKHSFVWASESIPVDVFYDIRSDRNNFFRGRYTVTPWLPKISNLGRMSDGFYEIDDMDWKLTFT